MCAVGFFSEFLLLIPIVCTPVFEVEQTLVHLQTFGTMEKVELEIVETALGGSPSSSSNQNSRGTPINPFGELFSPESEQGLREHYKTCWLCEGKDIRSFSVLDFDDDSVCYPLALFSNRNLTCLLSDRANGGIRPNERIRYPQFL